MDHTDLQRSAGVMRYLRMLPWIASLVLAIASVGLWCRSHLTTDALYVRTGGSFWYFGSVTDFAVVAHFRDWPDPPRAYYLTAPSSESDHMQFPPYGVSVGGTRGMEIVGGDFSIAYGTVYVELEDFGPGDLGSPGLPVLQRHVSTTWSSLLPFWAVTVPHWALVCLFLMLPTATLAMEARRHIRSRGRRSRGLCVNCGYDLCASPERCPECGAKRARRDGLEIGPSAD
jgi:hypothetical protein